MRDGMVEMTFREKYKAWREDGTDRLTAAVMALLGKGWWSVQEADCDASDKSAVLKANADAAMSAYHLSYQKLSEEIQKLKDK